MLQVHMINVLLNIFQSISELKKSETLLIYTRKNNNFSIKTTNMR
jgi:hypothetical protein